MSLTKAQIAEMIADDNGFTKDKAVEVVEALIELIKTTLASGDDVLVSGFGKFSVKDKTQRKGRNPATGEAMILDSRKIVTFRCSGNLRDRINREE